MGQVSQDDINEIKALIDGPTQAQPEAIEATTEPIETTEVVHDEIVEPIEETVVDDQETDEQEAVESSNDDDEYQFPSDLAALAEAIEVAPEDLYNIDIKMPDGQESIKLGDLKDQYSSTLRNVAQLEATVEEQKVLIEQAATGGNVSAQASNKKLQLMGQLQSIQAEYQSTDWNQLEASNPGEAALLKQKFTEAYNANQGQMAQLSVYEDDQKKQYLHKSATKVMELIPEWSDTDVRSTDTTAIESLLVDEGMSNKQVGNITDPTAIKLLNELVHLRAQVKSAEKTVEQVRKAPKVLRNKARVAPNKGAKTDALVKKAQSTHSRQDETAAIKAILGW